MCVIWHAHVWVRLSDIWCCHGFVCVCPWLNGSNPYAEFLDRSSPISSINFYLCVGLVNDHTACFFFPSHCVELRHSNVGDWNHPFHHQSITINTSNISSKLQIFCIQRNVLRWEIRSFHKFRCKIEFCACNIVVPMVVHTTDILRKLKTYQKNTIATRHSCVYAYKHITCRYNI